MRYYTPSIEDLYPGYKCEGQSSDDSWKSFILDSQLRAKGPSQNGYFVFTPAFVMVQHNTIRTKVLDEDDVISLGWNNEGNNTFSRDEFLLDLGAQAIDIHLGEGTYLYQGSCPSINELRTIMKLLNI